MHDKNMIASTKWKENNFEQSSLEDTSLKTIKKTAKVFLMKPKVEVHNDMI